MLTMPVLENKKYKGKQRVQSTKKRKENDGRNKEKKKKEKKKTRTEIRNATFQQNILDLIIPTNILDRVIMLPMNVI